MSYYQMDDGFLSHHKTKRALRSGAEALQMWLAMRTYVALNESDGVVPDEDIDDLEGAPADPRRWLKVLVECGKPLGGDKRGAGLVDPHAAGWMLHNYKKHGLLRKQLQARRDAAKERQRRWRGNGETEADVDDVTDTVSNGVTDGVVDHESNAVSNGVRDASPSHPIPVQDPPSGSSDLLSALPDQPDKSRSAGARARAGGGKAGRNPALTAMPEPFPLTDRHLAYGRSKNWPDWWVRNRHERFVDLAPAKGWRYADWNLAFYTFLRGEIDYSRGPAQLEHLAPRGAPRTPPAAAQAAQQNLAELERLAREQNAIRPRQVPPAPPGNANGGTRASDPPPALPTPPAARGAAS